MTPEQVAADVAERIRRADAEAQLATAAFAAGPATAKQYWQRRVDEAIRFIEETAEHVAEPDPNGGDGGAGG